MKTKNIFFSILLVLSNIVFYKQGIGVNFLLFHLVYLIYLLVSQRDNLKTSSYILLGATTLSSICIAFYGDGYSLSIYLVTLIILQGTLMYQNYQLLSGLLHQFLSFILAPILFFKDNGTPKINTLLKKYWIVITTIPVIMLFVAMYAFSNKLFADFIASIDLSFISIQWILFNVDVIIWLYGLIYNVELKWLEETNDANKLSETISITNEKTNSHLVTAGLFLLGSLNIILLLSNVLDIYSLTQKEIDASYSRMLHSAINMLILSIILAISIVLLFNYKRELLGENRKWMDMLTYGWIAQNIVLVGICVYKNWLYISEYDLTLKRIGVYVYLGLCLIGLAFTIIKISKNKTNWYYFNRLTISFIVCIACLSPIDWENYIIDYNVHAALAKGIEPDWRYLFSFSDRTIPKLLALEEELPNNKTLERYNRRKTRLFLAKDNIQWPSYTLTYLKTNESIFNHYE